VVVVVVVVTVGTGRAGRAARVASDRRIRATTPLAACAGRRPSAGPAWHDRLRWGVPSGAPTRTATPC